jgi:hypothetical protein|tara:strand:- start:187 stop:348 length:162 start_codon:yes stop_codon:yes gene_type:complete
MFLSEELFKRILKYNYHKNISELVATVSTTKLPFFIRYKNYVVKDFLRMFGLW